MNLSAGEGHTAPVKALTLFAKSSITSPPPPFDRT
jgi:hypothetical protein